ncbi:MAG: FapA family protein [Lachnospiraceae bacterium]|nr:FapA family protein [Lachnospiraceae bacterium]
MAKDAFFRIDKKSNGTYLVQYPPIEGGAETINGLDVIAYLDKKLGFPYDKAKVAQFFAEPVKSIKNMLLTPEDVRVLDEVMLVEISADKNAAFGEFFPPMEGGKMLDRDDIVSELVKAGVKYGVDNKAIDEIMANRKYVKKIQLATATLPIEGKEAIVKYFFNTDLTMKPQVNEDGSVDFHHLDMISPCKEGQLLAELTPAQMGRPGINVCGQLLKQVKVRNRILRAGKNIRITEDGLRAYSEINGHASLEGEMIFVSNTYEVAANVDTSTGDIEYDGDVVVHGNVNTGYSIKAQGDVIVEGVVEGALIEAGGNIILKRGISGMDKKGQIKAGLNVISKFIESAVVIAGGYVTSDSIMHSDIVAKGDVNADGKKGFISGGSIHSGSLISARNIGSSMGTTTILECGIDSAIIDEFHALDKELEANVDEEEKMMPTLQGLIKRIKLGEKLDATKLLQLKKLNERREWLIKRNEEINARSSVLKEQIDSYVGGRVRAEGVVHMGCKIIISNSVYYVKADTSYCSFYKENGDVKLDVYF